MQETFYSVEQVAERLGLHVKTVRNYIIEGRLKAVRIGKQYRISRSDLEALTGKPEPPPEPVRRERHVEVSSVIEIDAVNPETASRLSTVLMATADGIHAEAVYNSARAHLKIILIGSMENTASYFKIISALLERQT